MEWWNTTTSHSFASQKKNNVIGPSERIVEYFTKAQSPVEITLVILETSNFFPKFSQLPQLRVLNFPKKTPENFPQNLLLVQFPQPRVGQVANTPPGGSETAPEPLRKVSNWIVWRNSYGKRQQQNGYNTNMYTWIYLRSCTYLLIL